MNEKQKAWPTFDEMREAASRQYLQQTIERARGNIREAAKLAGRARGNFYWLLHRYGVGNVRPAKRGRWQEFGL